MGTMLWIVGIIGIIILVVMVVMEDKELGKDRLSRISTKTNITTDWFESTGPVARPTVPQGAVGRTPTLGSTEEVRSPSRMVPDWRYDLDFQKLLGTVSERVAESGARGRRWTHPSWQTVKNILDKKTDPRLYTLWLIAQQLGCDVADLLRPSEAVAEKQGDCGPAAEPGPGGIGESDSSGSVAEG